MLIADYLFYLGLVLVPMVPSSLAPSSSTRAASKANMSVLASFFSNVKKATQEVADAFHECFLKDGGHVEDWVQVLS